MSRLNKNANHVSPSMHEEVNKNTVDGNNNRSQVINAQMEFVISKRLLASLPVVPTNERVYDLAQDIQDGLFSDLGDIANCEQNWDMWVARTADILRAKGILVLSRLKKKTVKIANKSNLKYIMCDDWFIYSYDLSNGDVYSVNTEYWPDWDELSEDEKKDSDALEKYILPIAKNKWNSLNWRRAFDSNIKDEEWKQYVVGINNKAKVKTASQGTPVYFDFDGQKAWAYEDPGAPVELPNGEEGMCPECNSSFLFDCIDGDKVVLECCGCGDMKWCEIIKK